MQSLHSSVNQPTTIPTSSKYLQTIFYTNNTCIYYVYMFSILISVCHASGVHCQKKANRPAVQHNCGFTVSPTKSASLLGHQSFASGHPQVNSYRLGWRLAQAALQTREPCISSDAPRLSNLPNCWRATGCTTRHSQSYPFLTKPETYAFAFTYCIQDNPGVARNLFTPYWFHLHRKWRAILIASMNTARYWRLPNWSLRC